MQRVLPRFFQTSFTGLTTICIVSDLRSKRRFIDMAIIWKASDLPVCFQIERNQKTVLNVYIASPKPMSDPSDGAECSEDNKNHTTQRICYHLNKNINHHETCVLMIHVRLAYPKPFWTDNHSILIFMFWQFSLSFLQILPICSVLMFDLRILSLCVINFPFLNLSPVVDSIYQTNIHTFYKINWLLRKIYDRAEVG